MNIVRVDPENDLAYFQTRCPKEEKEEYSKELQTCSICMHELSEFTCTLQCNHSFHSACILHWAAQSKATCPMCRAPMFKNHLRSQRTDDGAGLFEVTEVRQTSRNLDQILNDERMMRLLRNDIRLSHHTRHPTIRNAIIRNESRNSRNRSNIISILYRKFMVFLFPT